MDRPVLDVGLVGQIVRRLDGNLHPLHGEERRQVGRVGRDDDEGERPPDSTREEEEEEEEEALTFIYPEKLSLVSPSLLRVESRMETDGELCGKRREF